MFQVGNSSYFDNRYNSISTFEKQVKILTWLDNVKKFGLFKYPKLAMPGKIVQSWAKAKEPHYSYAQQHNLWHYHIGHEKYEQGKGDYLSSNWSFFNELKITKFAVHSFDMVL